MEIPLANAAKRAGVAKVALVSFIRAHLAGDVGFDDGAAALFGERDSRPHQQRLGNGDAECLRGLEVDYQQEFSRLLNRQIAWGCTLEYPGDLMRNAVRSFVEKTLEGSVRFAATELRAQLAPGRVFHG